jgi:rSAM/selenodomain-associated transferase 2
VDAPEEAPRFAWWKRLIVIAITCVAVVSIYRQLDFESFVATLKGIRWEWLVGSVAFYGLIIAAAIGRWHLALGITHSAVHFTATARSVLIYHFITVTFLGAGVGDVAKSVFYSRWYKFRFPAIFAAAKLDRLMGTIGASLLWAVTLSYGAWKGAFSRDMLSGIEIPSFGKWIGLGVLIVGAVIVLCRNYNFRQGFIKFWDVLVKGIKQLLTRPPIAVLGTAYGLMVQGGLSFVLAVNLAAVTGGDLNWPQILWLFPVIQVISGLPFTVAGLGIREAAAMTLLGMYGVQKEEAAAAALLTLGVSLVWAALGGIVLWRETVLLKRSPKSRTAKTISVVIPAVNEANELPETLRRLNAIPEVKEIFVVDGGSRDQTIAVAREHKCTVLESPPGRGRQMRLGAAHATGDVVLLVHADTWLLPNAGQALLRCLRDPVVVGGGFWKKFREYPHLILYGSRFKCAVRLVFGRRIAGDQGLFIRREVLEEIGGVPDMELMEEFRLCEELRRIGRLALADATITTSARRFVKFGALRTYWLMWYVTWKYRLGTPPEELKKHYKPNS